MKVPTDGFFRSFKASGNELPTYRKERCLVVTRIIPLWSRKNCTSFKFQHRNKPMALEAISETRRFAQFSIFYEMT